MIKATYLYTLFLSVFITFSIAALSQANAVTDTSKGKRLQFESDRYNFQKMGTVDFISLTGHVKMKQELTLIFCDSAVLNQAENTVEAFGNIHINDNDSVHIYSQYLKYLGKEKMAYLKKKVKLTDGKAVLTTDEMDYNTFTKIGTYVKSGKVVDGTTVLTSQEGYYYGETRDMYFKKKVYLNDPQYKVYTDTLLYNTFTQIARFTVPTKIITGTRVVKTTEGYYDMKNRKAVFGKRPVVDDKDYTLTADDMAFDDSSHFGEAQGSVVYKSKDTVNAYSILSNNMKSNSKTGAILATQKPLMIIKQERDTVYVTADTLYSGKLTELEKFRTVPNITDPPVTDTSKAADASKNTVTKRPGPKGGFTAKNANTLRNTISVNRPDSAKGIASIKDSVSADTGIVIKSFDSIRDSSLIKNAGSIKKTAQVHSSDSTGRFLLTSAADTTKTNSSKKRTEKNANTIRSTVSLNSSDSAKGIASIKNSDTADTGIVIKSFDSIRDSSLVKNDNSIKKSSPLHSSDSTSRFLLAAIDDTAKASSTKRTDSVHLKALRKKETNDSSNNRFFEAYFNVKIFTDSLQAVGDSLFYSFRDSTFRLFKNPVVWSQDNQIVGDTIYLFTENKKPKRFYAFENALAINKVEKDLYNQVKGNTINGIFKNGNIDFVRAKGSAENIYYTEDEQGGFIGANRSTSDVIDVTFRERKPYRVVFRNNLQGTISPIRKVNSEDMRVRGFKWYDAKRPKSKFDLFSN